ncbi:hypothetical protein [Saccharopolyspora sp. CA-218241]|uniref:hypothetical protein n=1 Tax=Saccharopolyspora sp. CA-218241 TaxID=3240027 RepID=UPI003D969486
MSRARATAALSAGLVLAALVGGCAEPPAPPRPSSGAATMRTDTRPDATQLLATTVEKINRSGGVHNTVRGSLGIVGELNGEGVVQYQGGAAEFSLTGHTEPEGQRPHPVTLSFVDGVGYLKTPLMRPEPGKPWLRIASDGTDFAAKLFSPALAQVLAAIDPRATFAGIESATKIETSAPEVIDGRQTTRYDLRILTARAAELSTDPQQRERYRSAADSGQREIGYQLWLDESGLPVRFAATQDVAQAGQMSLTSSYRDWGTRVDIQPPPADRVGAFRDLPMPQAQPR